MFKMFERGEEVINLQTGLAGYIQSVDHDSGLATVKWIDPSVAISTVPVGRLMNSSDHLRMVRAKAIEEYQPALERLATLWKNRPCNDR
jgi:hypothetical protein